VSKGWFSVYKEQGVDLDKSYRSDENTTPSNIFSIGKREGWFFCFTEILRSDVRWIKRFSAFVQLGVGDGG